MDVEKIDRVNPIQTARKIVESALLFQHNIEYVQRVRQLLALASPEHKDYGLCVHTKIAAVYAFVSEKMLYIRDPRGIELHFSPENIMRRILAGEVVMEDCDSYAGMCLAMLWALGVNARLVIAGYLPTTQNGPRRYQHVFAQAFQPSVKNHLGIMLPARWVVVDPSLGNKTKEMNRRITVARIFDPFSS